MLTIRDEQLVRDLEALAAQQQQPIEALLRNFVATHKADEHTYQSELQERTAALRRKAYTHARAYWREIGDEERLQLSDVELDAQFCCFDRDGIPRLKFDPGNHAQDKGLSRISQASREQDIKLNNVAARQSRGVLEMYFADDLDHRKRNGNPNVNG